MNSKPSAQLVHQDRCGLSFLPAAACSVSRAGQRVSTPAPPISVAGITGTNQFDRSAPRSVRAEAILTSVPVEKWPPAFLLDCCCARCRDTSWWSTKYRQSGQNRVGANSLSHEECEQRGTAGMLERASQVFERQTSISGVHLRLPDWRRLSAKVIK